MSQHHLDNLPSNSPAEVALLGGLMLDNARFDDVADRLAPEDFTTPEHREIYRAIVALAADGQDFDLVTLAHALERAGRLEQAGGLPYLGDLARETPSAANVPHYARIVADLAALRRLARACADGLELARNPGEQQPGSVASEIEALLFAAGARTSERGPQSASALLPGILEDLDARSRGTATPAVGTGLVDLDRALGGLEPGQLVIVGARPGVGKSAFAMGLALHVALGEGSPVAFFSLEMTAPEMMQRALASVACVPIQQMRSGRLTAEQFAAVTRASGAMHRAPLHFDDTAGLRPGELRTRCRRLKRKLGYLGLIVVDYLQLMRSDRDRRNDNRVRELAEISGALKIVAKEIGAPVIALSQLNRALEERQNRRPMLSDLRESGSLEQDADVVLMLYREELHNEASLNRGVAELIVAKQRNGPTGTVRAAFLGELARFENLARP